MPQNRRKLGASFAVWAMRFATFVAAVWGALIVFFVNPINWKSYAQFTTWDWVWSWTSDVATAAATIAVWWFGQRFLTRKIDAREKRNA